jgi:glycolate oxidase FAD binding subunit
MVTESALTPEQLLAPLGSIVGSEHATVQEEVIVVAPADVRQVTDVLRFALANQRTVMPTGGCTKLGWGNPVTASIQMSMRRLAQLREHAWQDLTCTVEAGCTWAAMQAELARHGQMAALDPLWPEHATVGGVIASNDSGAFRLNYGGLRDLIIGMTVVLADGTIARSGGKVVKNVAGYDLHKLMTGSFGTLGVIAEVNFRLHPLEQHARTWSAAPRGAAGADPAAFAQPLSALMDSQMSPSGVQMRVSARECWLDIRIAGPLECFPEYDARIRKIFEGFAVTASDDAVWQARRQVFDSAFDFVFKVSAVLSELCSVLSELQKWAAAEDVDMAAVCQATGLMTIGFQARNDQAVHLLDRLRTRVTSFGGSAIALRLPDSLRAALDVWGPQSSALPLMREIKHRFDPGRILNPGRFVGNI